jgi:hypothetical protein
VIVLSFLDTAKRRRKVDVADALFALRRGKISYEALQMRRYVSAIQICRRKWRVGRTNQQAKAWREVLNSLPPNDRGWADRARSKMRRTAPVHVKPN